MKKARNARYPRWQDYRIRQLSFSINLFLSFSVASLAYAINLKMQHPADLDLPLRAVIQIWGLSSALGILATISRLLDFRYTARKLRGARKCDGIMASWCGPVTWGLFWSQILSFVFGALMFVLPLLAD